MQAVLIAMIVIPLDTNPFKITEKDTVRLTGRGIAGSRIEAKIEGPAKLVAQANVRTVKNGRSMIGSNVTEFDIKPTGKGQVKVQIIMKPPQPNTPESVTEYRFEVE